MRKITVLIIIGILPAIFILSPLQIGTVTSNSMEPTIQTGDLFIFYETSNADVGDIIVYESDSKNSFVTHRIIEESNQGFITKGDNNQIADQELNEPIVQNNDIIGKAILIDGDPISTGMISLSTIRFIQNNSFLLFIPVITLITIDLIVLKDKSLIKNRKIKYGTLINLSFVLLVLLSTSLLYIPVQSTDSFVVNNQDVTQEKEFNSVFSKSSFLQIYTYDFVETNSNNNPNINSIKQEDNLIVVNHGPYEEIGPNQVRVSVYSYPILFPKSMIEQTYYIDPIFPSMIISISYLLVIYLVSVLILPLEYVLKVPKIGDIV